MEMDAAAKGWMFKTAKENFWRVAGDMEFNDLLQEGYFSWARCCRLYPLDRRPQMMSKFMIAYHNEIHRYAKKRLEHAHVMLAGEIPDTIVEGTGLMELLAHAPKPFRRIVDALQSDEGARLMRAPFRVRRDGTRERTDERMARVLGPDFDAMNYFREFLTSS